MNMKEHFALLMVEVQEKGAALGRARGSWVVDGNTSQATARAILKGIEDGDPAIMDIEPAPLSGEHAGESINELSERFEVNLHDSGLAQWFEEGHNAGFWLAVEEGCNGILGFDREAEAQLFSEICQKVAEYSVLISDDPRLVCQSLAENFDDGWRERFGIEHPDVTEIFGT